MIPNPDRNLHRLDRTALETIRLALAQYRADLEQDALGFPEDMVREQLVDVATVERQLSHTEAIVLELLPAPYGPLPAPVPGWLSQEELDELVRRESGPKVDRAVAEYGSALEGIPEDERPFAVRINDAGAAMRAAYALPSSEERTEAYLAGEEAFNQAWRELREHRESRK